MQPLNEIIKNVLSLDEHFEDYEFIHAYLGPEELKIKVTDPKISYTKIVQLYNDEKYELSDLFPTYRKTYVNDFINSVQTQAKYFVFNNKNCEFKEMIENLFGVELFNKFDLEKELLNVKNEIQQYGFNSFLELKKSEDKISFSNFNELKDYIYAVIDSLTFKIELKYANQFPELANVIKKSKIKLEDNSENEPPCYYKYEGNYTGTVGFAFKNQYSRAFINGFIMHEVIPGHHLYYLLRQHYIDNNKVDPFLLIDTFYSPENVVNEGLAINADILLEGLLDTPTSVLMKKEKLFHKIMYNCWYEVNIEQIDISQVCRTILKTEMGYGDKFIDSNIEYFTVSDKFYIPCYPFGGYYVEKFLKELGTENLKYFYPQQSLKSLTKVRDELNGKNK